MEKPVAVSFEHPLWFEPLFAEFDRRGVAYEKVHAAELVFDPSERVIPYSLLLNRMSPSAWTRGHAHAIFPSLRYLRYLEQTGANVINGYQAF